MRVGPVKFHGSKRFSVSIQQTEMEKKSNINDCDVRYIRFVKATLLSPIALGKKLTNL